MNLRPKVVGIAGILAGLGLAVEGALFMTSGWTPETFGDPQAAVAFLSDNGTHLRAAVFAGAINLAFATVFIVGLAARLQATAPTRAAATLYFGIVGIAGHSLVPLGLWLGVPMFLELAASDSQAAAYAWGGYAVFQAAAGAVGSLFLGLSAFAAGWAIAARKAMPVLLGWVAIVMGSASAVTVLATDTPLAPLAAAVYLPSLMLAIVFRIWAGIELWKGERRTAPAGQQAPVANPLG